MLPSNFRQNASTMNPQIGNTRPGGRAFPQVPARLPVMKKRTEVLDLNVTLEDDVFVPGPAPEGVTGPWVLSSEQAERYKDPSKCCPQYNSFRRLPNIFGQVGPDPIIGSDLVKRLSVDTFMDYINNANRVLVMFYSSVDDKIPDNTEWSKNELVKAAEMTKGNYSYATLDCLKETDICEYVKHLPLNRDRVKELPFFNVFSKGNGVLTITDYKKFDAAKMKRAVKGKVGSKRIMKFLRGCMR